MIDINETCTCGHRHGLHTTNRHGLSANGMCLVDGCECMRFQSATGGSSNDSDRRCTCGAGPNSVIVLGDGVER